MLLNRINFSGPVSVFHFSCFEFCPTQKLNPGIPKLDTFLEMVKVFALVRTEHRGCKFGHCILSAKFAYKEVH